jgi:hypothetical protein
MPKDAVELPGDEVEDAGKSLDLVQKTLVEIVDRVERIERRLDLELQDDESDDAAMAEDAGGDAEGEAT